MMRRGREPEVASPQAPDGGAAAKGTVKRKLSRFSIFNRKGEGEEGGGGAAETPVRGSARRRFSLTAVQNKDKKRTHFVESSRTESADEEELSSPSGQSAHAESPDSVTDPLSPTALRSAMRRKTADASHPHDCPPSPAASASTVADTPVNHAETVANMPPKGGLPKSHVTGVTRPDPGAKSAGGLTLSKLQGGQDATASVSRDKLRTMTTIANEDVLKSSLKTSAPAKGAAAKRKVKLEGGPSDASSSDDDEDGDQFDKDGRSPGSFSNQRRSTLAVTVNPGMRIMEDEAAKPPVSPTSKIKGVGFSGTDENEIRKALALRRQVTQVQEKVFDSYNK